MHKYINKRVLLFKELGLKGKTYFDFRPFLDLYFETTIEKEFIFCITTANSTAISGLKFQKEIEFLELDELSKEKTENLLKKSGVRFYKRKYRYIKYFLNNIDSFHEILKLKDPRQYLLNFKGIGPKEASHFLRNIGHDYIAILDRHILSYLSSKSLIKNIPRHMNFKKYLEIEKIFIEYSKKKGYLPSVFDLIIWYNKTGKILK